MEKASDPARPLGEGRVSEDDLSPRIMLERVASYLDQIERDLLVLEGVILSLEEPKNAAARFKLQSLDQIIQSIAGLSVILDEVAAFQPETLDPRIKGAIARHRLKSLQSALLGGSPAPTSHPIELF
ncbi:MAG: hypothetical protein K9G71_08175 [Rhodobacteraceae bacterium]|nr:hypothetical protein [Paracoccaceae bacterium]MCF8514323.1 hypothetical protein [Paracoccaceae bacterium]MCF8518567.1 hypothetical protein [Paracoccaceae bacterium]